MYVLFLLFVFFLWHVVLCFVYFALLLFYCILRIPIVLVQCCILLVFDQSFLMFLCGIIYHFPAVYFSFRAQVVYGVEVIVAFMLVFTYGLLLFRFKCAVAFSVFSLVSLRFFLVPLLFAFCCLLSVFVFISFCFEFSHMLGMCVFFCGFHGIVVLMLM